MKYALLLTVFVGCSTSQPSPTAWQQALRISGETIVAKQDESLTILKENTNALAAIKSQIDTLKASQVESETSDGIGGDLESDAPPRIDTAANESLDSSPGSQAVSIEAVQLFICSTASCAPCKRMWRDVDDGKLDGFTLTKTPPFDGLKSYPAIRFRDDSSTTGWSVIYGYDEDTRLFLRSRLLGETSVANRVVSNNTPPVPLSRTVMSSRDDAHFGGSLSHSDMVALHNQLHGGRGQWTWPGDLSNHLQSVHGVVMAGGEQPVSGSFFQNYRTSAITSQRSSIRSFPQRTGFFGWARNTVRQSCPSCPR